MHKIYNKKLRQFRLNPRISLWTLDLYLSPNQSLGGLLNVCKDYMAYKVSGKQCQVTNCKIQTSTQTDNQNQ